MHDDRPTFASLLAFSLRSRTCVHERFLSRGAASLLRNVYIALVDEVAGIYGYLRFSAESARLYRDSTEIREIYRRYGTLRTTKGLPKYLWQSWAITSSTITRTAACAETL